jgi:hypothetical protein
LRNSSACRLQKATAIDRSDEYRSGSFSQSAAPTGFDILNPSDFDAGMFNVSPVLGLRPSRAGRALTEKRPKPLIATSSPAFAASMIEAKTEVTISFALAFEMSLASATTSASSVVFNGLSFDDGIELRGRAISRTASQEALL